ncbi:MAG: hypothetical protein DMF91_23570, partial [Acidobacteria bacterium]
YLGVPLEEFSRERAAAEVAAARQELGVRPDEFAIGTITRLHESKGNCYLVDAAARVIKERPTARFYLVGEGPLLPDLEAQAERLGLGDRFVFAGFRRDIPATLSAFDLSVFPSLWEGTPLTGFEALAMGKPIVATDADGLLDILRDGLADKIVWAMDHPQERARLGAAARISGRRYDIGLFVRKMERLYTLLHDVSRATRRRGVLRADLSFLTSGAPV